MVSRGRLTCSKIECDNNASRQEGILTERFYDNLHTHISVGGLSVTTARSLQVTAVVGESGEENNVHPNWISSSTDDHSCGIEHGLMYCPMSVDNIRVSIVELRARLLASVQTRDVSLPPRCSYPVWRPWNTLGTLGC